MSDQTVAWTTVGATFLVVVVLLILLLIMWKRRPLVPDRTPRRQTKGEPDQLAATSNADEVLNRASAEIPAEETRHAAARAAALRTARNVSNDTRRANNVAEVVESGRPSSARPVPGGAVYAVGGPEDANERAVTGGMGLAENVGSPDGAFGSFRETTDRPREQRDNHDDGDIQAD